ncbi:MAG: zinc ribbon domain-containing protein [Lachnoclostridium sp.]|nr:zinc ribbon domain-containing protein [Lachnospira sp.]MCM1249378.1 zinc ribbon domain-containing protein [Lachnoclostridium sp.]
MSLIRCPECNKEISDTVKKCPHCGYNIKKHFQNTNPKKRNVKIFAVIIVVLLCFAVILGILLLRGNGSLKNVENIIKTGSFACILSHNFEDATCQHGQICERCGMEIGQPTDHNWLEATCISPKICSICEIEEGEALGHSGRIGYCENCGEYINELQESYDMLVTSIKDAWDLIDESMDIMALTTSYYDTTYVAEANQMNYELQALLYDAARVAYQYEEFFDIGKDLQMAGAKLYLFDSLTSDTGFGSYEFITAITRSITDGKENLKNAQKALNEYAP